MNRTFVATNVLVFVVQLSSSHLAEKMISTFGYIPQRLISPAMFGYSDWEAVVTLFTSLFIHGGFVHLFGNMVYLWVFGDAVEDALGHSGYLIFYLMCGALGSIAHTCIFPHSLVPSIGASGSIAGVLGAFLVLHPRTRIVTLFPLVIYWALAEVRAMLFLPVWFAMQFLNGAMTIAAAAHTQEVAGIAWWAHVGGFLFGVGVALVVRSVRTSQAAREASEIDVLRTP